MVGGVPGKMVCSDGGKSILSIHFNCGVYAFSWQVSIGEYAVLSTWGAFRIGIERLTISAAWGS